MLNLKFDIRRLSSEDKKFIKLRASQEFQYMLLFGSLGKQAKKNVLKNPLHKYVKFES